MIVKGSKVQWQSRHNPEKWFKGVVLAVYVQGEVKTTAHGLAVLDDGTGGVPIVRRVLDLRERTK